MGRSVNTHVPARCQRRRASESAREVPLCHAQEGVSVNVASALATRRETAGCMARHVNVTIVAVKTWTAWSVEAMGHVPAVAVFVRKDGSGRSASIRGSVT